MASSTIIIDYLGEGTLAARPAAPALPTGGIGLYYATDNGNTYLYDTGGTAWVQIAGSTGSTVAVTAKTSNYTVTAADSGTYFTNTGAAGAVIFTLPAWSAGLVYRFLITAAQTLEILLPASGVLYVADTATAAAGNVQAAVIGRSISIISTDVSNTWIATSVTGGWAIT